jgi:hypothetical protein
VTCLCQLGEHPFYDRKSFLRRIVEDRRNGHLLSRTRPLDCPCTLARTAASGEDDVTRVIARKSDDFEHDCGLCLMGWITVPEVVNRNKLKRISLHGEIPIVYKVVLSFTCTGFQMPAVTATSQRLPHHRLLCDKEMRRLAPESGHCANASACTKHSNGGTANRVLGRR